MVHRTTEELQAGLAGVATSPVGSGTLELIVTRPAPGERVVHDEAVLDPAIGLVGDTWNARPSKRTADASPHPDMQLTFMNSRAVALVAGPVERWPLAGDQFYVDLALGPEELPPGTRLRIGGAVVEITDQPHTGCAKFAERFGMDAARFVNSPGGRSVNLRGVNARVIEGGTVRAGDLIERVEPG